MPRYAPDSGGRQPAGGAGPASAGVPDGLLLALLGFLISSTLLVWSAAGLSALLAHGSWPDGVGIGQSAVAVRTLVTDPADPAVIWPDAAPAELARPGLFWGVFIGQLMVLFTLALMGMGMIARWRMRRAERRAERTAARQEAREAAHRAHETEESPARTAEASGTRPGLGPPPAPPPAEQVPQERSPARTHEAAPPAYATASPPTAGPQPADEPVPADLPPSPGVAAGVPLLRSDADPVTTLCAATGPALVVTADPALWSETVGARSKWGPTHLYDPTHAVDAPVRLRWSPERGCEDMATAATRAAALLAPVRSPAKADEAVHDTAETILRCALHAAALDGQPFRQAHRWTTVSGSATDAVRILRKHRSASSGAAGELEAALVAHPERREEATALIRLALGCLAQLHVRNSCTATKADAVGLASFVAEGGTLYVVGPSVESPRRDPGAMPLVTALTTHVVELGRRMAARSSSGRLDPPMTVLLDAPATVAPLPTLPALLAEGPTYGLHTHAYHRSTAQAHAWWPELRGLA